MAPRKKKEAEPVKELKLFDRVQYAGPTLLDRKVVGRVFGLTDKTVTVHWRETYFKTDFGFVSLPKVHTLNREGVIRID